MSKKQVYVTRKIPQQALSIINSEVIIKINQYDRALTRNELEEAIKNVDGLLCFITDTIDSDLLDLNENLKVIANYAVGFNNIDIKACNKRKILVSNTPGVLTEATADLTWSLLMSVARKIVQADKFTRNGNYKGWDPLLFLGSEIYKKTLGIIGMGRIGQAVARRAKGFDMRVIYNDIFRLNEEMEKKLGINFYKKNDLLKEADFVTLHIPLLPQTKHFISVKELSIMKKKAFLINASRGPIVDEKALVEALQNKEIAGAGLDVYEEEPNLITGLEKLTNTVIVPHIGSATFETRVRMGIMAAENLIAGLKGKKMPNLVNPEALH